MKTYTLVPMHLANIWAVDQGNGVNMTIGTRNEIILCAWKHALELRSRALARATSCFCPADRGPPPSARVISSPRGFDSTTLAKWARLKAAHMSMSLCLSKGSKLLRIVPVNNTGTCMYTTCFLRIFTLAKHTSIHLVTKPKQIWWLHRKNMQVLGPGSRGWGGASPRVRGFRGCRGRREVEGWREGEGEGV